MLRIALLLVLLTISCTPESQRLDDDLQSNNTEEVQKSSSSNIESNEQDSISIEASTTDLLSLLFRALGILYIIFLHVGIVIIYVKYKNREDLIKKLKNKIYDKKRDIDSIRKDKQSLSDKLVRAKNHNELLLERFDELTSHKNEPPVERNERETPTIDRQVNYAEAFHENKEKSFKNILDENPERKKLYYSTPSKNGSFDFKKGLERPEGRMYYEVTYKEGNDFGRINYRTGRLDESALAQKDSILKPVCYLHNSEMPNPSGIIVRELGNVRLLGGKWVIKDKIELEFN